MQRANVGSQRPANLHFMSGRCTGARTTSSSPSQLVRIRCRTFRRAGPAAPNLSVLRGSFSDSEDEARTDNKFLQNRCEYQRSKTWAQELSPECTQTTTAGSTEGISTRRGVPRFLDQVSAVGTGLLETEARQWSQTALGKRGHHQSLHSQTTCY